MLLTFSCYSEGVNTFPMSRICVVLSEHAPFNNGKGLWDAPLQLQCGGRRVGPCLDCPDPSGNDSPLSKHGVMAHLVWHLRWAPRSASSRGRPGVFHEKRMLRIKCRALEMKPHPCRPRLILPNVGHVIDVCVRGVTANATYKCCHLGMRNKLLVQYDRPVLPKITH